MHVIQEDLKNISTDNSSMEDDALIDLLTNAWAVVSLENESQRHLVTESQFQSWRNFKQAQETTMEKNINEYTGVLTNNQRAFYQNLANTIVGATYKSPEELIASNNQAKALSPTVPALEIKEKKKNWISRIRGK